MTEETTIDWNAPLSGISNDVWREVDVASKYISQPNDTQDFARYADRLRQALARVITELRNRKPTASEHPEYSPELVQEAFALLREVHAEPVSKWSYEPGFEDYKRRNEDRRERIARFLSELDGPKSDPLVEALRVFDGKPLAAVDAAEALRAELAKRGGRIVFDGDPS